MSKSLLRRRLTCLAAVAILALLPAMAQASPLDGSRAALSLPRQGALFLGNLWDALASFWGGSGVSLDPDGQPAPTSPDGSGVSLDPDGQPIDSGGSIDPDGFANDSGMSIDPDG